MAASKAELWTQLTKGIDIVDTYYKFFSGDKATTPNLLADIILLQNEFEGNHIGQTQGYLDNIRNQANSMFAIGISLLTPVLQELGKIGYFSINSAISSVLDDIYAGMIAASETVTERNFTFGAVTPAALGANTGDGTVYRLTKDKNNYDIENAAANAGITKVEIIQDRYTGSTQGNEQAKMFGYGLVSQDSLEQGTAPSTTINLQAKRSGDGRLTNATFDTYSGVGAAFTVSGWDLDTPANFQQDVANYFRVTSGAATGVALEVLDNSYCEQEIPLSIDKTKPIFLIVRYYRKTVDGLLTITLGSKTAVVADLTTVADTTWIDLCIGVTTDYYGWYENWFKDGASVKVALTGRTTGTLLIDEIILAQPTEFDGKWYLMTAGTTDYLNEDYFTFTDTVVNTGRIQYITSRLFGKYFPHTSGVPTYPDA